MRRTTAIARMLLLFTGPFGLGAWLSGLVYINKSSRDSGKQKMNEAMQKLKSEKTKLWVFPEGYRNHSGQIAEFKKGAFHMAVQAQVPILPIVLSSYKFFMRKNERFFGRGEIIIETLPEISTKGLKTEDIDKLMEHTRDLMIKKYEELNKEIESRSKKVS